MIREIQNLALSSFVVIPLIAFVVSLLLTRAAIPLLRHYKIFADHGVRHVHKKMIPTMGGIAFVSAVCLVAIPIYLFFRKTGIAECNDCVKLLIPLLVLIPVGMLDDIRGIRARYKLIFQILTAVICWWLGIRISTAFGYPLPAILSLFLTAFWVVGYINAFNMIDGLDGLAAGIAAVSATCLGVVLILNDLSCYAVIMLCVAGGSLSFLRYNFHPARIFMGDTGSMFLGYMFATLAILSSSKSATLSVITISILACGIPLLDAFLAIWRRLSARLLYGNGQSGLMTADKQHLHHRLFQVNHSQNKTTLTVYFITLAFGICGIIASIYRNIVPGVALALLLLAFSIILKRFAVIEVWNSTQLITKQFQRSGKSILINMLHPLWDLCCVISAVYLSAYLILERVDLTVGALLVFLVMPAMIFLKFGHTYKTFWFRINVHALAKLFKILIFSYLTSTLLLIIFSDIEHALAIKLSFLTWLITTVMIFTERIALDWLKTASYKLVYDSNIYQKNIHTVIYGGGINASWYIDSRYRNTTMVADELIGIIDDALAFKGMELYGCPVLGSLEEIEHIYSQTPFEKLVISMTVKDEEKYQRILKFCKDHNIKIYQLSFAEQELQ